MAKLGQIKSGTMRVGNTTSTGYGIVYADEIIGHRRVNTYSDLNNIPAWALYNKVGGDNASTAVGQLWYVSTGDSSHSAGLYQLTAFDGTTRTWKYFKNGADIIDSDTTYTFTNGTNGSFTVTPKGGSAQTVNIGKPATAGTADNAKNATTAESATKATQDGSGNEITKTYLSKTEASNTYATKSSLNNYQPKGNYQPAGKYATLDDNGTVPASQLPSYVDDVVEFSNIVNNITVTQQSTTSAAGVVVYSPENKYFVFNPLGSSNYYNNWPASSNYNDNRGGTIQPLSGKIFVNEFDNNTYRWSGSNLIEISKSLALGRNSSTAFPGDAGAKLEKNFDALSKTVVTTTETLNSNSIILGNGNKSVKHFDAVTNSAGYLHWNGTAYEWKTPAEFSLSAASASNLGGIKIGYPQSGKNYPVQLDSSNKAYVNVPWTDTDTKYTLPAATTSVLGGIKLGSDTIQTVGANTVSSASSRTYAVQKNANSQLVVNVPWQDTVVEPYDILSLITGKDGVNVSIDSIGPVVEISLGNAQEHTLGGVKATLVTNQPYGSGLINKSDFYETNKACIDSVGNLLYSMAKIDRISDQSIINAFK